MPHDDFPKRPGYIADTRSRFGDGECVSCFHSSRGHFYWHPDQSGEHYREIGLGCKNCPKGICTNRKEQTAMSAVNLCERCDSLMLGKAVASLDIQESPSAYNQHVEMCPPCMSDFNDFMHSAPARDKHVYREPYKAPENETVTRKELL